MKKILLVNFFGQPGAGKSTGTAYVFSKLKLSLVSVEMLLEPHKIDVYRYSSSQDLPYRIEDKVEEYLRTLSRSSLDVVVTDCPARLTGVYGGREIKVPDNFKEINIYVKRVKPYFTAGRWQTEEESDKLAEDILNLKRYDLHILGNESGYLKAVDYILKVLGGR